jgi:outer membrane protein assembly factor BamB
MYFIGADGVLFAYDADEDKLLWRYALKKHSIQQDHEGPVSAIHMDERVFCLWDGIAFCFCPWTGRRLWMVHLRNKSLKPLQGHEGNFTLKKDGGHFIIAWRDRLFILHPESGRILRQRRIQYGFSTDLSIALENPLPYID